VGTLAQQFQPFKPLYRRLAQPVAPGARGITQIHNGNGLPINTRGFGQRRFHGREMMAKSGTGLKLKSSAPAHAEILRQMKPKAEVLVPEYKQVVEI
jgi:hypothetical protein